MGLPVGIAQEQRKQEYRNGIGSGGKMQPGENHGGNKHRSITWLIRTTRIAKLPESHLLGLQPTLQDDAKHEFFKPGGHSTAATVAKTMSRSVGCSFVSSNRGCFDGISRYSVKNACTANTGRTAAKKV